jgi:CHAD domain-containing protein
LILLASLPFQNYCQKVKKEQLRHITNNHYRKLKRHFKIIVENFDMEEIHLYRVEYKKLRALFRMLSLHNKMDKEIKIFNPLKKGYTIAGSIRDFQLQQQRIMDATKLQSKKPMAYFNFLQKKIGYMKPELSKLYLANPVAACKNKTDAMLPENFPLHSYRNFVQQKWIAILAIIQSGHFSDENIHFIRKKLKDIAFNLKQYKDTQLALLSKSTWKGKDETYYHQLLEELGNFQDKCVAVALLKSCWISSFNTYNRELLVHIKKEWIKDKLIAKKNLIEKLKQIGSG